MAASEWTPALKRLVKQLRELSYVKYDSLIITHEQAAALLRELVDLKNVKDTKNKGAKK
jgi:hypothetical protein